MAVRIGFAGTNWWAAEALGRLAEMPGLEIGLVLSQPDRPAGRGRKTAAPPSPRQPRALDLELAQPERAADALPLLQERGVAGRGGRRLRPARAASAAGRAAVRQSASLGAAALARGRAGRASADGR